MLPNYHIIRVNTTKYSETYGQRVSIKSDRFNQLVLIPFANEAGSGSPSLDTAEIYLKSKGHKLIGKGGGDKEYYLISDTFEAIK